MSNITKQTFLDYFSWFTHNPSVNSIVWHSLNKPPVYKGKMHTSGSSTGGGNSYGNRDYQTYSVEAFAAKDVALSAGSIAGSEVKASAILAAIQSWAGHCVRTRQVETGVTTRLMKDDSYTPPGAPTNGISQHRIDVGKVTATYQAFSPSTYTAVMSGTVSIERLGTYMNEGNNFFSRARNSSFRLNLVACHNSCHSACHGSRGRR